MLFLFVILLQVLTKEQCQIFDEKLILGDYYSNDGQELVSIEYKSYKPCYDKLYINKVIIKFEITNTDIYYLHTAKIYYNYTVKLNKEYNLTLGNKIVSMKLPNKYGESSLYITKMGQIYQIKNENSIFTIPYSYFNLESVHYIMLEGCPIGDIVKDLQKVRDQWIIVFGDSECQSQLSHLQIDAYIESERSKYISFAMGKQLKIDDYSQIYVQIHNETILELSKYQDNQLKDTQYVQKQNFDQTGNCSPYGQRISLGYYYTNYANGQDDIINIAYNTLSYCPNGFIHVKNDFGIEKWLKIKESRILNMSKIYENTSFSFTYVTYVNIVSLDAETINQFGQLYYYNIYGDINNQIGQYQFKVPLKDDDGQPHKIIFFGDMDSNWTGNNSNYTFNWFQSIQKSQDQYDFLVFEGDMAYDLESLDCQQGDWWLRNMTTFTSYYPQLATPGNHDSGDNYEYDYYRISFLSPEMLINTRKNYYNFYSVDLGLVHYIFYNPNNIVYNLSNQTELDYMVQVMEQDLYQANLNREKVPWIIVNSHYPMYCSDDTDSQCANNNVALRKFADLFTFYGVAMYMSAHQHNYERDAPFINNHTQVNTGLITDGPEQHLIMNSAAPVYIIEGAAGQEYFTPTVPYATQPFTIFQTANNDGVGFMTIVNRTHIYYEHLDLVTNQIVDYLWVVQTRGSGSEEAVGIALWAIFGIAMLTVIGVGVYYFIRRQKIKEQLLP